jgi:hypothetical protein
MMKPKYLGDGVYASFDGYQIWLVVEPGSKAIALEPAVLDALNDYARRALSSAVPSTGESAE